jgi:hypothetical protein
MTATCGVRIASIGLLAACMSGCMSYRLDRLPRVDGLPAPPPPERRVAATYSIRTLSGSDYQFSAAEAQPWGLPQARRELAGGLAATGWFRSVDATDDAADRDGADDPGGPEAGLHLDCVLRVRTNDVVLVAATMTLFVIPTWRTTTYELTVEARRPDGRWTRYQLDDATRDVHWLPLVLVMSFRPWGEAYGEVRANLYRTLVQRLQADGMLGPTAGGR